MIDDSDNPKPSNINLTETKSRNYEMIPYNEMVSQNNIDPFSEEYAKLQRSENINFINQQRMIEQRIHNDSQYHMYYERQKHMQANYERQKRMKLEMFQRNRYYEPDTGSDNETINSDDSVDSPDESPEVMQKSDHLRYTISDIIKLRKTLNNALNIVIKRRKILIEQFKQTRNQNLIKKVRGYSMHEDIINTLIHDLNDTDEYENVLVSYRLMVAYFNDKSG